MSGFDVGTKHVGDGAPCLIVAEVAQAHEGSLGMAHAYIDAIADAGADAVKFQCHIAEAESTPDEPWRVEPKYKQDRNRFDYWKRMEFTSLQWNELAIHACARELAFIVSPFSPLAVAMLMDSAPPDAWKVASGEIANHGLLAAIFERTRRDGRPVFVSTGMATEGEVSNSTGFYPMALLQCTSAYPCPPERVGLRVLTDWRERFSSPIGLSDHSGTIYAGLAAVALGCDVLEVHVTFSRDAFGFDVASSITTQELRQLVEGVRFIEKAKQPVDKDAMARELEPMRRLFMDKHKRRAALA